MSAADDALVERLLAVRDAATPLDRTPGADEPSFDLARAWRVAGRIRERRIARGERPRGYKIGFTNRSLWERYGVHTPIWAPVWDTTLELLPGDRSDATLSLAPFVEPRFEPEIVFGFASPPAPGMRAAELAACIDWVAHGAEIVHTHCAGWRFTAADTVADFGLHGRLVVGPRVPMADFPDPARDLANVRLDLMRDGVLVERGVGTNVLGGPLAALAAWLDAMAATTPEWSVAVGDVVTTGTLTDAAPLRPGERWTTTVYDARLAGLAIATTA